MQRRGFLLASLDLVSFSTMLPLIGEERPISETPRFLGLRPASAGECKALVLQILMSTINHDTDITRAICISGTPDELQKMADPVRSSILSRGCSLEFIPPKDGRPAYISFSYKRQTTFLGTSLKEEFAKTLVPVASALWLFVCLAPEGSVFQELGRDSKGGEFFGQRHFQRERLIENMIPPETLFVQMFP